jgi:hypothetical protein
LENLIMIGCDEIARLDEPGIPEEARQDNVRRLTQRCIGSEQRQDQKSRDAHDQ